MFKFIVLLLLSSQVIAQTIKEVHCPGPGREMMVADPAIVPYGNSILVMGTGDVLKWNSLDAMVAGNIPARETLKLFKEVTIGGQLKVLPLAPPELPWDLQFYTIGGQQYLYGGLMSPLPETSEARWPEDNISRRIKGAYYSPKLKGWVFKEAPVFGKVDHRSWSGHSYGQQIIRSGSSLFMLHEEISRDGVTEIFIRKMLTPFKAGSPKKIVGIENLSLESTRRVDGGHLLEGPRYANINGTHFIFFSTGDFPTKNYATRVAYSANVEGPYQVIDGDLTKPAHQFGLYGVGRGFPFKYKGQDWLIFHGAKDIPGVNHNVWPANLDHFQRCLFAAPLNITKIGGKIKVELK